MNLKFRGLLIACFLLLSGYGSSAQPGDPGGDPDVPISGIEILIGAGALLGVKRAISHSRNKK
jgi:hypothetical protein